MHECKSFHWQLWRAVAFAMVFVSRSCWRAHFSNHVVTGNGPLDACRLSKSMFVLVTYVSTQALAALECLLTRRCKHEKLKCATIPCPSCMQLVHVLTVWRSPWLLEVGSLRCDAERGSKQELLTTAWTRMLAAFYYGHMQGRFMRFVSKPRSRGVESWPTAKPLTQTSP